MALDEYCLLFPCCPAPDEPKRSRRIDAVDIHGSVATATITLAYGADTFTDVFLLVHVEGGWPIANKAYRQRRCDCVRTGGGHDGRRGAARRDPAGLGVDALAMLGGASIVNLTLRR